MWFFWLIDDLCPGHIYKKVNIGEIIKRYDRKKISFIEYLSTFYSTESI